MTLEIISVVSITYSPIEGWLEFILSVDFGNGPENMPFTYNPDDTEPVTQILKVWLENNPSFPISEE